MLINYKWSKYKLPDIFIIWVQKAWTTALFDLLSQQEYFYGTKIKEPHYFAPIKENFYKKAKETMDYFYEKRITNDWLIKYAEIYKNSQDWNYIIDASTHYFFHDNEFIKKIWEVYGKNKDKLKLIISLRNPLDRSISAFNYMKQNWMIKEEEEFDFFIKNPSEIQNNIIKMSLYSKKINNFYKNFQHKQILVILYDDIWKEQTKKEIELFLWKKLEGIIPKSNLTINTKIWRMISNIQNKYWKNKILKYTPKKIKKILKYLIINLGKPKKPKNITTLLLKEIYFTKDIYNLIEITGKDGLKKWL